MFISVLGSLACLYLSDPAAAASTAWLVGITAALLASGVVVHNDVVDEPSDRVRRGDKPLSSGAIRPVVAHGVGLALMMAAVFVAGVLSTWSGLFIASVAFAGVWYNTDGKTRHHIWGNIATSYGVAGIIVFPMVVTQQWMLWPLAGAVGVGEVGREILVTTGDCEGDSAAGFHTIATLWGVRRATWVALPFYLASIPFYVLSWGIPMLGMLYLLGSVGFLIVLIVGWQRCMAAVETGVADWQFRAFELWVRTGSRLGVVALQVVLLAEVWL